MRSKTQQHKQTHSHTFNVTLYYVTFMLYAVHGTMVERHRIVLCVYTSLCHLPQNHPDIQCKLYEYTQRSTVR